MTKIKNRDFIAEIKQYKGEYTYVNNVKGWLSEDRKLKNVRTVEELKLRMKHLSYYYPKDLRKVDDVVKFLT